jgi:hypothetical protein
MSAKEVERRYDVALRESTKGVREAVDDALRESTKRGLEKQTSRYSVWARR